jgi:hypothetical protein
VNQDRLDLVLQYALLEAGRQDEAFDRELGPIHLVKYVYLADLAHAERRGGETFTGAPWKFFHFGPWAPEVHERIKPALAAIGALEKVISSSRYESDFVRWTKVDDDLHAEVERQLPSEVVSCIKKGVRKYGKDTRDLLHYVYTTTPMLNAAPNDFLVFEALPTVSAPPSSSERPPISVKELKRQKAHMQDVKTRIAEKLTKKRGERDARRPVQPPRYDDVFLQGVAWMDGLAGAEIESTSGEVAFSEDVWTSPTRGERRG